MDRVSELLPKVLQKRGLKDAADAAVVMHHATQWLHEKLPLFLEAGELTVTGCKQGALIVSSTHPIASQECIAFKEELLQFLREGCGHIQVAELRIVRA